MRNKNMDAAEHRLQLFDKHMPREYLLFEGADLLLLNVLRRIAQDNFIHQNLDGVRFEKEEDRISYLLTEFEKVRKFRLTDLGNSKLELTLGGTGYPRPNLQALENHLFHHLLHSVKVEDVDISLKNIPWGYYQKVERLEFLSQAPVPANAFQKAYFKTIVLHGSKSLMSGCFQTCIRLTSINLSGLKSMGARCFKYCLALQSIDLSETDLTSIPPSCFDGCRSLTTVNFPPRLARINEKAFRGCPLVDVKIDPIAFAHPLFFVDPSAFDINVVLPEKPDYSPKIQMGELSFPSGTTFYSLLSAPIYNSTHADVLFFAKNIQLCLQATQSHDAQEWWLHMFKTKRDIKLLTSPRNSREGVYRMWEETKDSEEVEHLRVERKLVQLCNQYNYDGWHTRLSLDNYANVLSKMMYETALLSQKFDSCLTQIAKVKVDREKIKTATAAVLMEQKIRIKSRRKILMDIHIPHKPVSGSASRPPKKQKRLSEMFCGLRF